MQTLPDGTYDVIVVDTETTEDGETKLELAITLGPHIGQIVALRSRHLQGQPQTTDVDPLTLLGIPGTLRVHQGEPVFRPEVT
ncbi:MAG TPA: hypothetical protein VMV14_02630 [Acidimicrobiales bacterium]|nr:hypothetical protein [Acidimicrobiales bacterium]